MRRILSAISILVALGLSACAQQGQPAAQKAEKPKKPPLPVIDTVKFNAWLTGFKDEALKQGISAKTVNEAFAAADPDEYIIYLDRKQPETTLTMEQYLEKMVNENRIDEGRQALADNRALLESIGAQYGVQPSYIVALWGIETNYGDNTGNYMVTNALATLAFDGRRSEFFRGELMNALKIIDADHIEAVDMQGSWAGAMGQCQFMPSSFLRYAVDYDKDGKRDIWNTRADVFASIANYLKSEGWSGNPEKDFNVLLKWNRSRYFATAVGMLAENIGKSEVASAVQ